MLHEKAILLSLSGQDNTNLSKLKSNSNSDETLTTTTTTTTNHKSNKLTCDDSSSNNFENIINDTSTTSTTTTDTVSSTFYFNLNNNNNNNTITKSPVLNKRNSLILNTYSTKQRKYYIELKQQQQQQETGIYKNLSKLNTNSPVDFYRIYTSKSWQSLTSLKPSSSFRSSLNTRSRISCSHERLTNEKKETCQLLEQSKHNRIESIKQMLMSVSETKVIETAKSNGKANATSSTISSTALIRQKSMLKKPPLKQQPVALSPSSSSSSPPSTVPSLSLSASNGFKYDSDLNLALLSSECDEYESSNENAANNAFLNQLKTKLESCQLSLLPSTQSNDRACEEQRVKSKSGSMKANLLIVSRQGTVRGSLNHVKTSLKEIFKEPKITNPVLNAQLNNTNYEQMVRSSCTKNNKEEISIMAINKAAPCASSDSNKKEKFSTIHYFLAVSFYLFFYLKSSERLS
jgi:hypothetical protein